MRALIPSDDFVSTDTMVILAKAKFTSIIQKLNRRGQGKKLFYCILLGRGVYIEWFIAEWEGKAGRTHYQQGPFRPSGLLWSRPRPLL